MECQTLQQTIALEVERLCGGAPIRATVVDGVVTLSGPVENETRRVLIEQELLRLPEVADVRNHLQVATPAGDLWTQLITLLEREDVPTAGLTIAAESGAIVLSGQAAGWFDRDAAERLAWTLPGVRSVDNRITLPPDAVQPDAEAAGDTPA